MRNPRLLRGLLLAGLACCVTVPSHGQDKKKSVPAPSKPAAPAKPAAAPAAHGAAPAAGAHTAGPATTTASHGPTTSGGGGAAPNISHGPTTSAPHGPTTSAAGAGGRPNVTTGGFGRGPGAAPVASHGPMAHPAPMGTREVHVAGGSAVRMREGNRPADFHDARRNMDIHHNLAGGGRRIMVERPDHSRLVFERGRGGYIGHPYAFRGHEYERRAYYFHGRAYNRFYSPYGYRGAHLLVYAPARYYSTGFYGWAYNPWARPYPYAWGFASAPWYGYYGAYYSPYSVYPTPSLWLTDYMISNSLAANYEAQMAAGQPQPLGPDAAPMTPEVKQLVSDEVQQQIALENAEATMVAQGAPIDPGSSSIARQLSDGKKHAFMPGTEVDVTDVATGQECAVTEGDVLKLNGPPPPDATEASLTVVSSKGGRDCRNNAIVTVPLDELQEMQNHMRETIDAGLGELQAKQGQGGLPTAPPSATTAPQAAGFAELAPPPDPNGEKELVAQAQVADQSEHDLTAEAAGSVGGPSDPGVAPVTAPAPTATVNISLGQSIADIKAALGPPVRIVELGPKTIYVYKDMKVTFKNGKVSDVE